MTDESTAEPPATRVVELEIALSSPKTVGRVEVRRITIQPGVASGIHLHNGPVFGTILRGSVLFEVAGESGRLLAPGDVFFEAEDTQITHFDAQSDGVEFIGVFPLEPEQEAQIWFPT